MITKKAGTVLVNIEKNQVGLVYREKKGNFSFPKGHLEKNESLTRHLSLLSGNVVISIPFSYNKPIDFTKTNCLKRGSNTT